MTRRMTITAASVVAFVVGGAVLACRPGTRAPQGTPDDKEASRPSPRAERRVLYYRNPMDPSVHSDHPAKDPMGMDYVPVYDEEAGPALAVPGRAAVALPAERAALLGIRSEPVLVSTGGGALRTVGRVAIDERRRQVVYAKYDGYVEKLHADFTGQFVRKGDPLLALYSPELVAAQNEYLVVWHAEARLGSSGVPGVADSATELRDAGRQRLRSLDLSSEDIAALERTGAARRTLTLRSPVTGVVVQKMALEGLRVSREDRLYELADLSRVWILAEIFEKDAAGAGPGTRARVSLPEQAGEPFSGTVTFVSPTLKPETRTFEVRVEVDNRRGLLKPDMFAEVLLEMPTAPTLTVPESAVVQTGERSLVFVDEGEGRYEPREVLLGARIAGGYEVRRGVAAGERVVVSANFLLDSESSLRAAITRGTREH